MGEIEGLRPAGSFMGVPHATAVKRGQAAILGLPFDCGTHPTRTMDFERPARIEYE